MTSTLLSFTGLPPFQHIQANEIEPAVKQLLEENRAQLTAILAQPEATWDNTIAPLEQMQHRLSRTWSPVGHLNGVMNSDELRTAYNACLPLLSAWHTDLGQNEQLYRAYERVRNEEGARLNAAQLKLLDNALRDFRLSGVALPADKKARYKEIMEQLTQVQAKFDENVLDATNAWSRQITDTAELAGLPAPIIERARAAAEAKQQSGWLFTLDAPNYMAVLMHGENENLRREFYQAWVTRASDQGLQPDKWDNTALIEQIMQLRHELAGLVGFDNYATYSLATKMAKSVEEVKAFLDQLAVPGRQAAQRELDEIKAFAGRELNSWDVGFYSERMKQQRFDLSEEALRPYFPAPQVLSGLFAVASRLYNVQIVERKDVEKYHEDVQFFDILNGDGSRRGSFYVDLYARAKKRGGAWMDDCVGRMQLGQSSYLPVAYLVCNFMPPLVDKNGGSKPALLTHSEVVTMFHEFGHGLHHMLTRVDYPSVSGINGVPWDAVELPSQFMENFAWQPEVLPLISKHVETGLPLPAAELQRLLASRTFQAGMQTVRQLEFALLDLRIHAEYTPARGARVLDVLEEVRTQVAVMKPPAFNRFPNSFSHIFSGGYAAGYYSYKWAEVLAADAFSAFEENGVFNPQTAHRFASAILEKGGSRDAMEAFVEFRGRKPKIEPLLKQLGLAA
ncbi:MAG: M3 family metallopeptidase [Steroidobacteraceae bacterium]